MKRTNIYYAPTVCQACINTTKSYVTDSYELSTIIMALYRHGYMAGGWVRTGCPEVLVTSLGPFLFTPARLLSHLSLRASCLPALIPTYSVS